MLQDVLTLDGRQFRNAAVIVASPPCQAYSYMAMPWKRAKALAASYRESQWSVTSGMNRIEKLNELFDACFRIAREASQAATLDRGCKRCGVYHPATTLDGCDFEQWNIPLVVENVKGAQPWVGRAKWHYGSYYLWGDVPALMPSAKQLGVARGSFQSAAVRSMDGIKVPGNDTFKKNGRPCNKLTDPRYGSGVENQEQPIWFNDDKRRSEKCGGDWFGSGEDCSLMRRMSSKSNARKAASAQIAKIPFPLAQHIARVYKP